MSMYFNADEVFQLGVDIERNGQEFYQAAMERAGDIRTQNLFRDLMKQEKKHELVFENLRRGLAKSLKPATIYDLYGESDMYLKALAETHVFNPSVEEIDQVVTDCKTPLQVIDLAIHFEKESIVFFLWMKDHTKPEWGRDKINQLIRQEQRHIVQLYHLRQGHMDLAG